MLRMKATPAKRCEKNIQPCAAIAFELSFVVMGLRSIGFYLFHVNNVFCCGNETLVVLCDNILYNIRNFCT